MTSNLFENLPEEMKAYPNFLVWRLEDRGGKKPSKVPYSPHVGPGKVNDKSTWGTFDEALCAYQSSNYHGIGFVFSDTPFVGIDIDNCYDEDGTASEEANQACTIAQSYVELSQSGKGLHIIMRGTLPSGKRRRNTTTGFEMYGHGSPRYFAMTGNTGGNSLPIRDCQEAIDEIYARYIAEPEPEPAAAALAVPKYKTANQAEQNSSIVDAQTDEGYLLIGLTQDQKFLSLYNGEHPHGDESSDDMALFNKLAYWSNDNAELMKQVFLTSPHYQQKDTAHKQKCQREDYLRNTLAKSLVGPRMTARAKNAVWQQEHDSFVYSVYSLNGDESENMFFPLIPFETPDDSSNPGFPTQELPDLLRRITEAVAESFQVSPDMVAVALITIISLLIQKRFEVTPKDDWTMPVNLYTLIIARPSDRKSPILTWLMQYPHQYITKKNDALTPEVQKYKMQLDLFHQNIEKYKKAHIHNKKVNGVPVTVQDILTLINKRIEFEKTPVNYKTLSVNDITMEALAVAMADNDEKMGIVSAEGGMFQILSGLYSGGTANIDVVLNSFNGEAVQINRKGSKNIAMQSPTLTILLMVQPTVLSDVMDNRQFVGRGLLARFLFSFPQSIVGSRKYNTVPVPPALESEYKELIDRLLELASSGETSTITYSNEAKDKAEQLHNDLEPTLRDSDSPALEEWGGKHEGRVARIAALLHIAQHVEQAADIPISGETFAQAKTIGDYFIDHAKFAYQSMGATGDQATQDATYIWNRLSSADVDEMSKRELHQTCSRKKFPKVEDMKPGLDVLIDRGYIAICKQAPTQNHQNHQKASGGRPTEIIYINPLLRTDDATDIPNDFPPLSTAEVQALYDAAQSYTSAAAALEHSQPPLCESNCEGGSTQD